MRCLTVPAALGAAPEMLRTPDSLSAVWRRGPGSLLGGLQTDVNTRTPEWRLALVVIVNICAKAFMSSQGHLAHPRAYPNRRSKSTDCGAPPGPCQRSPATRAAGASCARWQPSSPPGGYAESRSASHTIQHSALCRVDRQTCACYPRSHDERREQADQDLFYRLPANVRVHAPARLRPSACWSPPIS